MPVLHCPIPSNQALPEGVYRWMTLHSRILRVLEQEDINFLLTNRIPRRLVTQFMGWFSQIEHPLVRDISIGLWRVFSFFFFSGDHEKQIPNPHRCFLP